MGQYIVDFLIIFLQLAIVYMISRWIKLLLDVQRDIKNNRYTSMREVIKNVKKED